MGTQSGKQLALYHYEGCWYCMRVQRTLAQLGLFIEQRNVLREPQHRRELVAARGRATVPVLRIVHEDGREEWMPESRDIIRFLESSYGSASASDDVGAGRQAGDQGLLSRLFGRR